MVAFLKTYLDIQQKKISHCYSNRTFSSFDMYENFFNICDNQNSDITGIIILGNN